MKTVEPGHPLKDPRYSIRRTHKIDSSTFILYDYLCRASIYEGKGEEVALTMTNYALARAVGISKLEIGKKLSILNDRGLIRFENYKMSNRQIIVPKKYLDRYREYPLGMMTYLDCIELDKYCGDFLKLFNLTRTDLNQAVQIFGKQLLALRRQDRPGFDDFMERMKTIKLAKLQASDNLGRDIANEIELYKEARKKCRPKKGVEEQS